jgi:hypothetical protein
MTAIRPLQPDDIPSVAGLFQRIFRNSARPAPEALTACLADLFLQHPWQDPDLGSRVHVGADGAIGGFVGVLPLRLTLHGKPVRAAVAGSLMVERPHEQPTAGARLLRSVAQGPQDLALSETANALSAGMWARLGGEQMTLSSLEWIRVFHPAGFALALAAGAVPPLKLMRPIARLADRIAGAVKRNPLRLEGEPAPYARDSDLSDDALVPALIDLAQNYALRPDWDEATLRWLFARAARKGRHGPMIRRAVLDRRGALMGCYVYYARPQGIAWVLQILARPDAADAVVASLFTHAHQLGAVAIRGRTHPRIMAALMARRCLFLRVSATIAASRDPACLDAIRAGDALLGGLAGESFSPLIGDTF